MSGFDKICAVFAFILGAVFLLLGVFGLFIGCNARFTLPPVLGVLPAFVGWGIVRAVYIAWNVPPRGSARHHPTAPRDTPPPDRRYPTEDDNPYAPPRA